MTGIVLGGFTFAEDAYIQSAIVANAKVEPVSGQAISTGYCPGPTTRVEVDCEPMDLTTKQQRPFGGRDGAVRFAYCTTINWNWKHRFADPPIPVLALVQFAELKDGKIEDISRHCMFKKPLK